MSTSTPVSSGLKRSRDQVSPLLAFENKVIKMSLGVDIQHVQATNTIKTLENVTLGSDAPIWANLLLQSMNTLANNQKTVCEKQEQQITFLKARVQQLENTDHEKILFQEH